MVWLQTSNHQEQTRERAESGRGPRGAIGKSVWTHHADATANTSHRDEVSLVSLVTRQQGQGESVRGVLRTVGQRGRGDACTEQRDDA